MNFKETETNVLWEPIYIDASVHDERDFSNNNLIVYYYEEPEYKEVTPDESPSNSENLLFIKADFKKNSIERL